VPRKSWSGIFRDWDRLFEVSLKQTFSAGGRGNTELNPDLTGFGYCFTLGQNIGQFMFLLSPLAFEDEMVILLPF
jgi:hypothetical protein